MNLGYSATIPTIPALIVNRKSPQVKQMYKRKLEEWQDPLFAGSGWVLEALLPRSRDRGSHLSTEFVSLSGTPQGGPWCSCQGPVAPLCLTFSGSVIKNHGTAQERCVTQRELPFTPATTIGLLFTSTASQDPAGKRALVVRATPDAVSPVRAASRRSIRWPLQRTQQDCLRRIYPAGSACPSRRHR